MTAREAIRLILDAGGVYVRPGSNHDIYALDGHLIPIPRHGRDLSKGVESQVLKAVRKR